MEVEEMIEISGKISNIKTPIKINRFFIPETPVNGIGFLCACKDEFTQSFAETVAARYGNNEIIVEDVEIGKYKFTALIVKKEAKEQIIKAAEDFDRMLRGKFMRGPNVPKNVQ
jgi:hypothetical protein